MELTTMTTAQLQQEAKNAGLPTWGTKNQLIQRLQEAAAKAVTGEPVAVTVTAPVGEHAKTLDKLQASFGHIIKVKYDDEQKVFQFEGGPQGRLTTTAHQPAGAIAKVAAGYINTMQNAKFHNIELGKFGE